jgi:urea transport system permease protein
MPEFICSLSSSVQAICCSGGSGRKLMAAALMLWLMVFSSVVHADDAKVRSTIAKAMVTEDADEQVKLIQSLASEAGPLVGKLLEHWKGGDVYLYTNDKNVKTPVTLSPEKDADGKQGILSFVDGTPVKDADGKPVHVTASDLDTADTDAKTREAIKDLSDMAKLADPDPLQRLHAVQGVGMDQDPKKLPALQARLQIETDGEIKKALLEAISLTQLKGENMADKIAACKQLGSIGSIASQDTLKAVLKDAKLISPPLPRKRSARLPAMSNG